MKSIVFLIIVIVYAQAQGNEPNPRIKSITLSPHLTELVYSAGGANTLVGVSSYSNYPEIALTIPVIGDAFRLDLELIKTLDPDVIFYWKNGTANQVVEQLNRLDFNLHEVSIHTLSDIPRAIQDISQVLNTTPTEPINHFLNKLNKIKNRPHTQQSALIQISNQPIYTVNGSHWMSEAIEACGLQNIFANLEAGSAAVTMESIIFKQPQVIINLDQSNTLNPLSKWNNIPAIKNNHIIHVNADKFSRPTLRILDAIETICAQRP